MLPRTLPSRAAYPSRQCHLAFENDESSKSSFTFPPWITSYPVRWSWNVKEALKLGISLERGESNRAILLEVQCFTSREVDLPC